MPKGDFTNKGGPLLPIQWPQAWWRIWCVPQGACFHMCREWYWAVCYTEVWVVASDRQVMYWAPKRKRPLHSSAYRLILQWGRALRFDTARAVAVHSSSGHTISQLLSRNKSIISTHAQEAWSVARGGHSHSCGLCTQVFIDLFDTAQGTDCTLFTSSRHISVSVTKQVWCKPLIFFPVTTYLGLLRV